MYRVSIGHLSGIYRKIPTDVRLMRGLRTASRKTHILSDFYFCLAVLFSALFSSRSNAMGGVKDIFETKVQNKRKNKGQKEPGMRKMRYICGNYINKEIVLQLTMYKRIAAVHLDGHFQARQLTLSTNICGKAQKQGR